MIVVLLEVVVAVGMESGIYGAIWSGCQSWSGNGSGWEREEGVEVMVWIGKGAETGIAIEAADCI